MNPLRSYLQKKKTKVAEIESARARMRELTAAMMENRPAVAVVPRQLPVISSRDLEKELDDDDETPPHGSG